jgi:hypothetical protein
MRVLFLLLVLGNLAFYAWTRFGAPADAADSAPLARQIEPDKLKVVAPDKLPAVSASRKPAATPPAPVAAAASAAAAPAAMACVEWGSFTVADAPKAAQALEPLALGTRLEQRRTDEVAGWWVFVPPQRNRQAALRKAAELRELGVGEFFIVQEEGEHRWALSLGVFRTEEAARARLAALRAQGLRTARVGARDTVVPKVWLQVKSVDAPLQARLKEIARQVEGSELKECS